MRIEPKIGGCLAGASTDERPTHSKSARMAQRELLPDEHFVESGYVNAELLVYSQRDHGVSLQGPVRGLSAKAVKAEQVTCPQGHVLVGCSTKSDPTGQTRMHVRFGRADCGAGEARPSCTTSKEARRTLFFHPRGQYEALNAARARGRLTRQLP
jgi:transposase